MMAHFQNIGVQRAAVGQQAAAPWAFPDRLSAGRVRAVGDAKRQRVVVAGLGRREAWRRGKTSRRAPPKSKGGGGIGRSGSRDIPARPRAAAAAAEGLAPTHSSRGRKFSRSAARPPCDPRAHGWPPRCRCAGCRGSTDTAKPRLRRYPDWSLRCHASELQHASAVDHHACVLRGTPPAGCRPGLRRWR